MQGRAPRTAGGVDKAPGSCAEEPRSVTRLCEVQESDQEAPVPQQTAVPWDGEGGHGRPWGGAQPPARGDGFTDVYTSAVKSPTADAWPVADNHTRYIKKRCSLRFFLSNTLFQIREVSFCSLLSVFITSKV